MSLRGAPTSLCLHAALTSGENAVNAIFGNSLDTSQTWARCAARADRGAGAPPHGLRGELRRRGNGEVFRPRAFRRPCTAGPDGELLNSPGTPNGRSCSPWRARSFTCNPRSARRTSIGRRPSGPLCTSGSRFEGEIWPTNADRVVEHIRARFDLAHDVLRHSFFSYVVGAEKSVERAALESGTTESILCRHYLKLTTTDEAQDFWRILPPGAGKARKWCA